MQFPTIRRQAAASLAAGVSLILFAGHGALAQETPLDIVGGWLEQANNFPFVTVAVGGVAHDADTGITTVSDLDVSVEIRPDELQLPAEPDADVPEAVTYRIRFPEVTFAGLSADAEDYRADEIRVRGGTGDMQVDTADAATDIASTTQFTGYAVHDVRWSRLPQVADDPQHPVSRFYPLAEALLDFDFSGAEAGPVVTITELPEMSGRQTVIYGPMKIGAASRGDISEASVDIATMSVEGTDNDGHPFHVSMHVGPITLEDYNYGTLLRTFAPGGMVSADADRPYRTYLGAMRAPGLTVTGKAGPQGIEFEGGIGSMAVTDMGVRAPLVDFLGRIDALLVAAQQPDAPEPDETEIIELVASFYGAFRLGLLEIGDVRFDVGDIADGKIESVRLRDLSARGLSEFSESGIDIKGPEGFLSKLDRFAIENVSFPSLDALIGLQAAQDSGDIAAMLEAIPTIGRFLYSGVDTRVPGELEFQLEKGLLEMSDHIGPIPTRIDLDIEGLRVPAEYMDPEAREQLRDLGYDELDASLAISAAWNGARETAELAGSATLADGGSLAINAEIGGLARHFFENPQAAAMGMALLTLNSADFTFKDNSIRDRVMRVVAEQQNTTSEMVGQMAVGVVPFVLAPLQRPELASRAAEAVRRFFDGEGNFLIAADPAAPVPLLGAIAGRRQIRALWSTV